MIIQPDSELLQERRRHEQEAQLFRHYLNQCAALLTMMYCECRYYGLLDEDTLAAAAASVLEINGDDLDTIYSGFWVAREANREDRN